MIKFELALTLILPVSYAVLERTSRSVGAILSLEIYNYTYHGR